jgi:hypothetical protein
MGVGAGLALERDLAHGRRFILSAVMPAKAGIQ